VALPGVDVVDLLLDSADLGHLTSRSARAHAEHAAVVEHLAEQATSPMEYVR